MANCNYGQLQLGGKLGEKFISRGDVLALNGLLNHALSSCACGMQNITGCVICHCQIIFVLLVRGSKLIGKNIVLLFLFVLMDSEENDLK